LYSPNKLFETNFNTLVASIERGECAIFIGAGLSMPIGYPSLLDLLHEMAKEARIVDLEQKKAIDKSYPRDFQTIKNTIGVDKYHELLLSLFDHTKRNMQFNSLLLNVLQIPFCSFITTNYDPCLEFAFSNLSAVRRCYSFSYPNLPVLHLRGNHIFHPHGYINPENPDSVNSIILSEDEFATAYEYGQETSIFFRDLFEGLDVLFIGFGWNDLSILDIVERVKKLRKIREDIAVKQNFHLFRDRSKFAIIDDDTYQRDKSNENYIDRLGIVPIIYEKKSKNHYLLTEIVQEIQRKTSKGTMMPLPTIPVDFPSR
jgi:hypothetical protein